jgi:hypothetical protein
MKEVFALLRKKEEKERSKEKEVKKEHIPAYYFSESLYGDSLEEKRYAERKKEIDRGFIREEGREGGKEEREEKPELLPLIDGTEYLVEPEYFRELIRLYPSVNVIEQFRLMRGWLLANPRRRKTRRGVKRFIHFWLSRALQGYHWKRRELGYHRTNEGRDWVEIGGVNE